MGWFEASAEANDAGKKNERSRIRRQYRNEGVKEKARVRKRMLCGSTRASLYAMEKTAANKILSEEVLIAKKEKRMVIDTQGSRKWLGVAIKEILGDSQRNDSDKAQGKPSDRAKIQKRKGPKD